MSTTDNTDDDGVGFDLSAWEAPPPPAGIADAVIARAKEPIGAAAIEPETKPRTRWYVAGGVLAAAAVAGVIGFGMRSSDGPVRGSGAVAVAKPSHLELGGTAIDLEANTDVWWVRDGSRVTAMQPRGVATWRVAADEQLVIDAGATVASVSASGASLRVEVEMNLSDARLVGTSAATAAAVALVTVIVYEGHVKVTGGDKTVEVAAGSTVQIAPNKPPVEPDKVSGLEKRLRSEIEFLKLENELLRKKAATVDPDAPAPTEIKAFNDVMATLLPAMQKCGTGSGIRDRFELKVTLDPSKAAVVGWNTADPPKLAVSRCVELVVQRAKFPKLTGEFTFVLAIADTGQKPDSIADFDRVIESATPLLSRCGKGKLSNVLATIVVEDDGKTKPQVSFDTEPPQVVRDCVVSIVTRLPFAPTTAGAFEHLIKFVEPIASAQPKPPSGDLDPNPFKQGDCNDKDLVQAISRRGDQAIQSGNYVAALAEFERIMACDSKAKRAAYLAACRTRNFAKAKRYFRGMPENFAQICLKEGFDPR